MEWLVSGVVGVEGSMFSDSTSAESNTGSIE